MFVVHKNLNMVSRFCKACAFAIVTVFAGVDATALPSGYTELEYIASTGTQYINTGFVPNADFKHTLVFEVTSSANASKYICGSGVNDGRSGNVRINGNTIDGIYINKSGALSILSETTTLNGKSTLVLDLHNNATNTVLLNGKNIANTSKGTITSSLPLQLFAMGNSYKPTGVRIYSSRIEQNGAIVHNFVPAKNSSNVIGMYDTVTNTFKTNAGSGTFIAGPVVTMKIATKKYNDTMFSPVKTRVNNVSSTLDNIVSTTLTQATTVNTLKNSKQNRPNSVCPTGKKCLLVRDVNGNDNWYEIVGADAAQ